MMTDACMSYLAVHPFFAAELLLRCQRQCAHALLGYASSTEVTELLPVRVRMVVSTTRCLPRSWALSCVQHTQV